MGMPKGTLGPHMAPKVVLETITRGEADSIAQSLRWNGYTVRITRRGPYSLYRITGNLPAEAIAQNRRVAAQQRKTYRRIK